MRKITTALLLMLSMGTMAQKKALPTKRNITITPINQAGQNTRKNVILNASDFIPIGKGDVISLQPNLTTLPKQHQFMKGVLKSAAAFALTYQVNKAVNSKGGNDTKSNTNLAPALGISLIAGLPNIVQGLKNKKSYLIYTTYDANKVPIYTQKIVLKKQYQSYTLNKISSDGFLKAMVIGNGKRVIASNFEITIAELNPKSYRGQMGKNFDLNSFGDCSSGGGDDGPACSGTCIQVYNCEIAKCTAAQKKCVADCTASNPGSGFFATIARNLCIAGCHYFASSCARSASDFYLTCQLTSN